MKTYILLLLLPLLAGCSGAIERAEVELISNAYAEQNYAAVLSHFSAIDPSHYAELPVEARKMVGIAFFQTADPARAERMLTDYLKIKGEDGEAHFYLGLIKGSQGEEYCHHMRAAVEQGFKLDIPAMFVLNIAPCKRVANK